VAYLRGADLRGANLRGADLREADLQGADLRRADLRRADLREAIGFLGVFFLRRHQVIATKTSRGIVRVQIGCKDHPLTYWGHNYKHIGTKAGYSPEDIKAYGKVLQLIKQLAKIK